MIGKCDPLYISEVIRVVNIPGLSDGEVPGITVVVVERSKIERYEVSGTVLSGGSFECARYIKLDYRSEELKESELRYLMVSEGGYEKGLSYKIF